jgi:hypothetical protein
MRAPFSRVNSLSLARRHYGVIHSLSSSLRIVPERAHTHFGVGKQRVHATEISRRKLLANKKYQAPSKTSGEQLLSPLSRELLGAYTYYYM